MYLTERQIQRSMQALIEEAGHHDTYRLPPVGSPDGDLVAVLRDEIPVEVFTRVGEIPYVRPDRLAQARLRLQCGQEVTADELAARIVGRCICDRLR